MVEVMADTVVMLVTTVALIHLTPQNQVVANLGQNLVQKVHLQPLNQVILVQNQVPIQVPTAYFMVVVNQHLHEMHFVQVPTPLLCLVGNQLVVKQNPLQIIQQIFHHYIKVDLWRTSYYFIHFTTHTTIMFLKIKNQKI